MQDGSKKDAKMLFAPMDSEPMSRCSVWFKYWENWYSTSMICSMQLMYSLPQLVSRIGEQERSKIGLPMRFSTFLTMALSAGCEINSFSAAREKLISLYTAYTYSILRNMRTPPKKVYHKCLIISNIKKQYFQVRDQNLIGYLYS